MKLDRTLGCVVAAMFLWACGDDGSGGSGGNGGGSEGGADQGGTSSDGGAGGETSDGGAGGEGTGGGAGDDLIDPISLGHAWTYDVTEIGTFALCPSGSHTGEAIAESELDGRHAIEVTNLCAGVPSSQYSVEGDVVYVNYQGTWLLALDAPVEEGHTWSNGTSTFTWHDEGTVTVPAGTFDDCWRSTQNVAYESWAIFCRGVGPVHWYSEDLSGNGFEAVLTSVNF